MDNIKIGYVKTSPRATEPSFGTEASNGADLYSAEPGIVTLEPGDMRLIRTDIIFNIPPGMFGFVTPRSGMALKHRITVLNAPGLIDQDYRQGVGVILMNMFGPTYEVSPGDRIAQIVFLSQNGIEFIEEDEPDFTNIKRSGGFGSTGK